MFLSTNTFSNRECIEFNVFKQYMVILEILKIKVN